MGDALPDELDKELVGASGFEWKGGVTPNEEFVRLDGGDESRGDKGGVAWAFISADQIVCPGKEPKLPGTSVAPLGEEEGTGTQPFREAEIGQECEVPSKLNIVNK